MRLFFALPLPEHARRLAASAQRALGEAAGPRARLSFASPAQLHLTLAFLGEQDGDLAARAAGREAAARVPPFDIALSGAGAFPGPRRPRTLWLGVETGKEGCATLAAALRAELQARAVAFDDKPFRPHLTVARVKPGGERAAGAALASVPGGEIARFHAASCVLYRSHLGAGGAAHEPLETFALAAPVGNGPVRG